MGPINIDAISKQLYRLNFVQSEPDIQYSTRLYAWILLIVDFFPCLTQIFLSKVKGMNDRGIRRTFPLYALVLPKYKFKGRVRVVYM